MKPKATTMQQRMGFADPDLTSPKHDELVLWLVENRHEVAVSCGCKFDPVMGSTHLIAGSDQFTAAAIAAGKEQFANDDDRPSHKVEILLESPIMDNKFVIGFIDAIITVYRPELHFSQQANRCGMAWNSEVSWEWEQVIGARLFIEAKPTIPSFGELLRQLRHYEPYLERRDKLFVFSPDTRFKVAIEQQGIGFIVAPHTL